MYKFPIRIPEGWCVILTQGFKSTELSEWYTSKGLNYPEHLAVDIVIGNPNWQQYATYGAAIVCPVETAELISSEPGTDPGSSKGGRFQIKWTENGNEIVMGGLHCSEVVSGKTVFYKGDEIAYIGNGGYVKPEPNKEDAYAGGHLHLSVSVREPGKNAVPVDPLLYFNIYEPFRGEDTGFEKDIKPIAWAMVWSADKVASIIEMFRKALNKQL